MHRITPATTIMRRLKQHRQKQNEQRLFLRSAWRNDDNFVFTDELGEHLVHDTAYEKFKRIVKELGFLKARFHNLRHSYAVAALQAGDDIKTVQENLGHHTAAFTLDVYGHVTDPMKRESAVRMDRFIQMVSML